MPRIYGTVKKIFCFISCKDWQKPKKKGLLLFFMKKSLFLSFVKMRNSTNFKQFTNYIT